VNPYNNYLHIRLLPILFISCCLFSGCEYFSSSPAQEETSKTADEIYTEEKNLAENINSEDEKIGNPIDYKTPTIKKVFVTTRNGIEFYEGADDKSTRLGKLPYGEKVEVIEELMYWYAIKYNIQREYKTPSGNNVTMWQWEKVFIKQEQTGDISQIKLNYKDLITTEDKKPLKKISIRFVTKDEYLTEKANAVDFLDTTNVIKPVKGKLRLPCEECKQKYITYLDSLHSYMGEIPPLNQYLISAMYYDSWGCALVDKTTGKKLILSGYPYITPDKQHFMTLDDIDPEKVMEFSLYNVDETNKIKKVFSTTFTEWIVMYDKEGKVERFMGSNGKLYAKVFYAYISLFEDIDKYNQYGQYICISLK
jgi:hypothetical protein